MNNLIKRSNPDPKSVLVILKLLLTLSFFEVMYFKEMIDNHNILN